MITSLSAITLATGDMALAVRFYRAVGFEMLYGGEEASFTSFRAGDGFLNLSPSQPRFHGGAGRSFTSPMSTACINDSSPRAFVRKRRRVTHPGASVSFT
jgi:hypothetical protein